MIDTPLTMTRTTRRSVDKDRTKAEEMPPPPPPPPSATAATAATVVVAAPQAKPSTKPIPEASEAPITVHKRIRAPLLDKVFEKSLKASLSGITPEAWNKCFPTPTVRRPEQMKEVRKKFCEIYELNVRKNFQDMISSRKLLASLDNLDILISEAQTRKARFLEENPQPPLPMDPPPKPTPVDKENGTDKPQSEEKSAEASSTEVGVKKPEEGEGKVAGEETNKSGVPLPLPIHNFTPEDLYMSHLHPILKLQSARLESLKQAQQSSIDTLIKRREEQQAEMKQLIATLEKRLGAVDEAAQGVKEILEMDADEEMME
ncbi:hypothetical protein TWF225_011327 [Orbilia oligospora]|nr:hypothetical protein TWF225_011327 [Orbilia oligospora]KAF3244956.1 hypothetical protein TWF217_010579 [Orbilia oligospora]KAF3265895.1 hypothetical protein TWF128_011476 [Orbilia oligospora]KAF3290143.1 hypothetical protein TWF132_007146 [Orbilia oligospora]